MTLTRRDVVVKAGAVAAWATFGGVLYAKHRGAFDGPPPFDRAAFPEPDSAAVAVLRAERYGGDLEGLLRDGLRLVEADVRGRSVVLKPNFVEFLDGHPINTQPPLIVAAADAMRSMGARSVVVAEGPGHRRDTEAVVEQAGPARGARRRQAAVRRPQRGTGRPGTAAHPLHRPRELWVPKLLRDADVVVSMPKLKTHHWVAATLSLKNCFGCMPGRVYGWPKDVFHVHNVPNSILDIVGAVRPSFAIIDGIVGMEGNGPLLGTPVHSGVVVVSKDRWLPT